jgi:PAS domain S-box-containing protein
MNIKNKLRIMAVFPVVLFLISGTLFVFSSGYIDSSNRKALLGDELVKKASDLTILSFEYNSRHEERPRTQWLKIHEETGKLIKQASVMFTAENEKTLLADIAQTHKTALGIFTALNGILGKAGKTPLSPERAEYADSLKTMMLIELQAIIPRADKLHDINHEHAVSLSRTQNITSIVFLVALAISLPAGAFLLIRSIITPLSRLEEGMKSTASDVFQKAVPVYSDDELGRLTDAFNDMALKLNTARSEVREVNEGLERLVEERTVELKESEERYRLLFNSGNDGIVVHPPILEGVPDHFLEVNEVMCSRLGYSREEMLSMSPADIDDPDDPLDMTVIRDKIRSDKQAIFEKVHVARDGTKIPVEINSRLFDLRGEPTIMSIVRDITGRKEAERQIRRNSARLKTLYEISRYRSENVKDLLDFALHEIIHLTESKFGYIYFYDETKQLFELNSWSKEVMKECSIVEKKTCYELSKTGIWGEAVRRREPVMLNDFAASNPLKKGYPEGHVRLLKYLTIPIIQEDTIVAVAAVANKANDYTESDIQELTVIMDAVWKIVERQRADQRFIMYADALERSNKELELFAYVASHDLQEPLRKVASFTELLASRYRGKTLDERAETFMDYIVDGARRLQALINDLLSYSRVMTQGREFSATDCNAVVKRVLRDMELVIKENNAEIVCGELPVIRADDIQIGQLFQNLLGNALKYHGEEQPKVHITVELKGGERVFAVKDNGIGMEAEYLEKIFVIFQRLHSRAEYSGTGIGLAVCRKIVERHGGRIWVESEPGNGSTFYFTIPDREENKG